MLPEPQSLLVILEVTITLASKTEMSFTCFGTSHIWNHVIVLFCAWLPSLSILIELDIHFALLIILSLALLMPHGAIALHILFHCILLYKLHPLIGYHKPYYYKNL